MESEYEGMCLEKGRFSLERGVSVPLEGWEGRAVEQTRESSL